MTAHDSLHYGVLPSLDNFVPSPPAGEDYTEVSQVEVVFQPAEDRVTYQLLIEGDDIHEAEETFLLRLSQPSGDLMQTGVQLGRSEAVITVIDDDGMT